MLDCRTVPVIGLVGGIGSGKSSLACWLAARRNVLVADGDEAGHRALEESSVKQQIRQRFGDTVFDEKGEVSRAALGRLVFGSTVEARRARSDLEGIVHPRIRETFRGLIREARASGDVEAVILDAAVLLEAKWDELCDAVVFVDAPYSQRLQRVAENRGWDERELALRESSQLPLDVKRTAADATIKNSDTVDRAGAHLEHIFERIINRD